MSTSKEALPDKTDKIAIVGSGLIGKNWAMIFAGAGYNVTIFDIDPDLVTGALDFIKDTLAGYEQQGVLRGGGTSDEQIQRISGSTSLAECLKGARHVQECVPENVELKKKVFAQLDELADVDMVLASSSSCLIASLFTESLKHRENCLVAHPVNPPYFLPLVELVPAPWTRADVMTRTRALMEEAGQSPITLRRECLGFALNRIQYACINECWNMYQTGLLSAEDIDKVCTDGLGIRYAFIGPLETMHLNAEGVVDYCERYADGAVNVQKAEFKPLPVLYDVATARKMQEELAQKIPLDKLTERRKWRDDRLSALSKLKKELGKDC